MKSGKIISITNENAAPVRLIHIGTPYGSRSFSAITQPELFIDEYTNAPKESVDNEKGDFAVSLRDWRKQGNLV